MEIAHSYSYISIRHFSRLAIEHMEHEVEQTQEETLFKVWLERYQHMAVNTTGGSEPPLKYEGFGDFKDKVMNKKPKKELPIEEILERTQKAVEGFREVKNE